MRGHLSWKCRYSRQRALHFSKTKPVTKDRTCHQRPPVFERPHFYGQLDDLSKRGSTVFHNHFWSKFIHHTSQWHRREHNFRSIIIVFVLFFHLLGDVWELCSVFCATRRNVVCVCSIYGRSCGRVSSTFSSSYWPTRTTWWRNMTYSICVSRYVWETCQFAHKRIYCEIQHSVNHYTFSENFARS